jgi:hypothetical protein
MEKEVELIFHIWQLKKKKASPFNCAIIVVFGATNP